MRTSPVRAKWKVGAFIAATIATLVAACGNSAPPVENGASTDGSAHLYCYGTPEPGCPCNNPGATAPCGEAKGGGDGYVVCAMGTTTCTDGVWGACSTDQMKVQGVGKLTLTGAGAGGGTLHPDSLGMSTDAGDAGAAGQTQCTNNPCDPSCGTFVDNSNGVDGGPGLVPTDAGGWTLAGEGGAGLEASTQCFVSLTGTVYDPAALEPVYNAVVAIPYAGNPVGSGSPPAISTGVPLTNACGGNTFAALRAAYTDVNGKFTLPGVPVQSTVTVVIQIGRWRRVVTVNTSACGCGSSIDISTPANTCLGTVPTCAGANNYNGTSGCLTRLPRQQTEGNIPHIAVGTGGLDAIECMLYRMGVSSSEYTDENGTGRIHMFNNGGANLAAPAANHDVSYLLGYACPSGICPASVASNITNPGFDTGNLNGWTKSGSYTGTVKNIYTTKSYSAIAGTGFLNGENCVYSGDNTLSQTFTAPAGVTGLAVDEYELCSGTGTYVKVTLKDNTTNTTQTCQTCDWKQWDTCSLTATPGHSYTLTLTNHDPNGSGACTETFFDNVHWTPAPTVSPLLNNYDMVILPCDGGGEYSSDNWGYSYDDPGRTNLVNYANVGGRIFTSHWGREWIERGFQANGNSPFPNVATWISDDAPCGNCTTWATGDINTGSTWGNTFNQWMTAVGAAGGGQFTINPWREDTSAVSSASRLFVSYDGNNSSTQGYPADFTFDTPLGGTALGRVMYTDMHLANGTPSGTFPANCPTQGSTLLNQEAAAEYLIFDLGACVSGQPVPPNYPPITTTGNGTNSTCSGGTGKDLSVGGPCTTDADCEMDFHCASGTCIWSQGNGYYDSTCLDSSGNPGIDLTIGVPCSTDGTHYDIPICNRGGGTLASGSVIKIENSGNGGSPSAPWNCAPPPTPKPPSVSGGSATCSFTLPMALGPGQCMDIDTSTAAGAACSVLEVGERYLYINYDQSIPECGTGFSGSGPGCMNNTTHTKTTGNGCPAACGASTTYHGGTFTRDFQGVCPAGFKPVWRNFTWSGQTPNGTSLDFQAWTADTQAQLGVQYAMSATLESPSPDNSANGYVDGALYGCTQAPGAPACTAASAQCLTSPCPSGTTCCNASSNPTIVDTKLAAAGYPTWGTSPGPYASHSWLRVSMTLNPSSNLQYAPTLLTWNQSYDCVAAE